MHIQRNGRDRSPSNHSIHLLRSEDPNDQISIATPGFSVIFQIGAGFRTGHEYSAQMYSMIMCGTWAPN